MKDRIVYWGGGFAGLTGAVHFALAGYTVLIYDPNEKVVDAINAGTSPVTLPGYQKTVAGLVEDGSLKATADKYRVWVLQKETHVIAVPSERDGAPFMEIVFEVVREIVANRRMSRGVTILIESTLTPGTMHDLVDMVTRQGEVVGRTVYLAACPRRDWFPSGDHNLKTLTRIVGGVTPACTERAVSVLALVSDDIRETTSETAELVKSLENALLHLPVALIHQLAVAYPEHNVVEAVELAGTHWRLPKYFLNGFGASGRCVNLGSRYLVEGSHGALTLSAAASLWDIKMRSVIADVVLSWVGPSRQVLVLGIGYRPD